jgi:hypothetical protein
LDEIVIAASLPLLAGYTQLEGYEATVGLATGVIGLIVVVLAGVMNLYRFQDNWNEYGAGAESLEQVKYLYLARVEPYGGEQPFALFVQSVEALLKSETTGWAQAMRVAGAAD